MFKLQMLKITKTHTGLVVIVDRHHSWFQVLHYYVLPKRHGKGCLLLLFHLKEKITPDVIHVNSTHMPKIHLKKLKIPQATLIYI